MIKLLSLIFRKIRWQVSLIIFCIMITGCATHTIPPESPKYVEKSDIYTEKHSANSLWSDKGFIFGDVKARSLNDIVMIRIVENITGLGKANTKTGRDSSMDATVEKFFGAPLNFNNNNFWGKGNTFSPEVKGSMKNSFKGDGETARQSKLDATISAKVVEVLPNGNLVLESRKEIVINRENQILVLRGIARPEDILPDNTILSTKIADSKIYLVGEGVIGDKQGQGWLVRIIDKIWPF